jgi:hypothetical protein
MGGILSHKYGAKHTLMNVNTKHDESSTTKKHNRQVVQKPHKPHAASRGYLAL